MNASGGAHVILEGAINYPEKTRLLDLIDRFKITQFGFAATVVRLMKKEVSDKLEDYNLSSIRTFGNAGEPIDRDTWSWVIHKLGKGERPLTNLSGGTDMFGPLALPSPVMSLKPSTLWL